MTDPRKRTGALGERAAEQWLTSHGYRIVERNWRCRLGEIDLIVEYGATIAFVEVRTRSAYAVPAFGVAVEAIPLRKQWQVRRVASVYLAAREQQERQVRFDAIAVTLEADGAACITHIPNAF